METVKRRVGKPAIPQDVPPNLASTWRQIVTAEQSLTDALKPLNAALDMKVTVSRFGEWERGSKGLKAPVINYMMAEVLPVLLDKSGVNVEQLLDSISIAYNVD